jgi:hypothetical protein
MGDPGDLSAVIEKVPGRTLLGKLRRLLPLIDERIKEGVSYQDIIEALNSHGGLNAEVKASTLRAYLCRYRKRASATQVDKAARQQAGAARANAGAPLNSTPKIRNASDLKRLRSQEVDLDELSRIGRRQGGG